MAKFVKKFKPGMGTAWFLAIIIISVIGAYYTVNTTFLWLILAICGAVVAILDIQTKEERGFLIAISALIVIMLSWLLITDLANAIGVIGERFLVNLMVAFGVAGFVIALSKISKIGLY